MASAIVRTLAHAASRIFYRVECVNAVPARGAVMILPNHPNSLLDPAVIWATAGRDVRFLAKSTLFSTPLRPLLAGAGAIPVYRRIDQGVDTSKNTETFAAVEEALAAGDAVCLFPEGISHSTGRLAPLRTGAARMALGAERKGTTVAIVPVGLNFDRKTVFRSRVIVVYGQPFSAADLLSGDGDAVRALTDRIAEHMRRLLVEADPGGDDLLVDRVDRLYAAARGKAHDPEERVARRRAIAAGMERLRSEAPQRYEEIYLKFRRYDERLKRFGLRDRHLDWHISSGDVVTFAVRELLAALVLVPVSLAALALFVVPYLVTHGLARIFTIDVERAASAKVLTGMIVYPLWTIGGTIAAWKTAGPAAGIAALVLLPLMALAGLFAIERESAVLDTVRAWLLLRRTRRVTRRSLRRYRSELADVLDEVYEWITASARDASAPAATRTPS